MVKKQNENWIRQLGLQLAAQLPPNQADALAALEVAARLVRYMASDDDSPLQEDDDGRVISFRSPSSAASSAKRS